MSVNWIRLYCSVVFTYMVHIQRHLNEAQFSPVSIIDLYSRQNRGRMTRERIENKDIFYM